MNVRTLLTALLLAPLFLLAGCAGRQPLVIESGTAAALPPVEPVPGYLTAPLGGPLKNVHGQCWRTADWRPALAIEECDPLIVRENRKRQLEMALAAVAPVPTQAEQAAAGAGVAAAAPAEEASAPAAVPAPAAAPTMADLISKPVVLNTDAAFFFGKDNLTRAGRDAVENLAAYIKLWNIEDVQVEVTGHTDRIGNARDNQALSERRAAAVRAVLVEAGVPREAVTARGVGSTQPLTAREDCPDDLVRCDLINCLAPDRRVEVGLKGKRLAPAR